MLKQQLLAYLPQRVARAVAALPSGVDEGATELRLRLEAPISVTVGGKNRCFNADGVICPMENAMRCSAEELRETVALLTRSSLYSFGESIKQGFLPFGKGNRAGICGDAIVKDGAVCGFRSVYAVNLRVSRHVRLCGMKAARRITELGGVGALVISPPGGGKTTLLRSVADLLSSEALSSPKRVALADERGELFVPELHKSLVDVMLGVPKVRAVELLCRSMSPQFLVCDEISPTESASLLQAANAGVSLIASAHAGSLAELCRRPFAAELLAAGVFPLVISLKNDYTYETEEYVP